MRAEYNCASTETNWADYDGIEVDQMEDLFFEEDTDETCYVTVDMSVSGDELPEGHPEVWCVFAHYKRGGRDDIHDCSSEEEAWEIAEEIMTRISRANHPSFKN